MTSNLPWNHVEKGFIDPDIVQNVPLPLALSEKPLNVV